MGVDIIKKQVSKVLNFLRKSRKSRKTTSTSIGNIIPRSEHAISRKYISPHAIKVLYRLHNHDYRALLVGGGVRDLLLGREPKDFDVVTDAKPQQIRDLFRNARLIGRRFRLVHILFRGEIIETCTFRAGHTPVSQAKSHNAKGMIVRDNIYGTIDEDANRRDFTINALYYDIADFSVIDFHNGIADLQQGILRMIGDPEQRYREDPVRMLRAVRFAAKLGFRIEPKTEAPIFSCAHLLQSISADRIFLEVLKLFLGGAALETFKQLHHYELFGYLFPLTNAVLNESTFAEANCFINHMLTDTDLRINAKKTLSPGYFIAALLWLPLQKALKKYHASKLPAVERFKLAYEDVIAVQQKSATIPRYILSIARTIWDLQKRLEQRKHSRCAEIIEHKRFRAAYDFLYLRARSGEKVEGLYQWWTAFYEGDNVTRQNLLDKLPKSKKRRKTSSS